MLVEAAMRKIMICLLLLSMLGICQAQENITRNITQDLDANIIAAFYDILSTTDQKIPANSTISSPANLRLSSYDSDIADAEQMFNTAASLNSEDIELALKQLSQRRNGTGLIIPDSDITFNYGY